MCMHVRPSRALTKSKRQKKLLIKPDFNAKQIILALALQVFFRFQVFHAQGINVPTSLGLNSDCYAQVCMLICAMHA
jgi:hypothetical protein